MDATAEPRASSPEELSSRLLLAALFTIGFGGFLLVTVPTVAFVASLDLNAEVSDLAAGMGPVLGDFSFELPFDLALYFVAQFFLARRSWLVSLLLYIPLGVLAAISPVARSLQE